MWTIAARMQIPAGLMGAAFLPNCSPDGTLSAVMAGQDGNLWCLDLSEGTTSLCHLHLQLQCPVRVSCWFAAWPVVFTLPCPLSRFLLLLYAACSMPLPLFLSAAAALPLCRNCTKLKCSKREQHEQEMLGVPESQLVFELFWTSQAAPFDSCHPCSSPEERNSQLQSPRMQRSERPLSAQAHPESFACQKLAEGAFLPTPHLGGIGIFCLLLTIFRLPNVLRDRGSRSAGTWWMSRGGRGWWTRLWGSAPWGQSQCY